MNKKPRRWFVDVALTQWRFMCACDDYEGPFFLFPNAATYPWSIVYNAYTRSWQLRRVI